MTDLEKICADAYEARVKIGTLDTDIKNKVLNDAADNLLKAEKEILEANKRDVATAEENMKAMSMIDRLSLDHDRLLGMADGLRQIAKLADPIGEVMSMAKRPNGLIIGKRRVAIGVVGIIFEARPNVTSDAFGLCFKTGNCVILKGGSDAINTNIAIVKALKKAFGITVTQCSMHKTFDLDIHMISNILNLRKRHLTRCHDSCCAKLFHHFRTITVTDSHLGTCVNIHFRKILTDKLKSPHILHDHSI